LLTKLFCSLRNNKSLVFTKSILVRQISDNLIIAYRITSITAERRDVQTRRIDVNSTPKIVSVEKRKKDLGIGFEFLTIYNPNMGQVRIIGELLYREKNLKEVLNYWEKNGKLPEKTDIEVKNFLFRKCLTLGVTLSEQLNLPPPVMFPMLAEKKELREEDKTTYIG